MNPGDIVWWKTDAKGSRTGRFVRTVKRGHNAGLVQIEPTDGIPRKKVYIAPEHVKPSSASIRWQTQRSFSF